MATLMALMLMWLVTMCFSYVANSWMLRLASNHHYVLAPTSEGKVFIWTIATEQLVGILAEHGTLPCPRALDADMSSSSADRVCRHRGRREGHCIPSSAAGTGHVQRWYHCPRAGLRCQFDG